MTPEEREALRSRAVAGVHEFHPEVVIDLLDALDDAEARVNEFIADNDERWREVVRRIERERDEARAEVARLTANRRHVECVECGIAFPSHHDFLNHLAAIERHHEKGETP